MRKTKKIFIWTIGIDDFLNERGTVGGITVQMYFWAQAFIEKGWKVYSFSEKEKKVIDKIQFLKFPTIPLVGIFVEFLFSFFYIASINPQVIIIRGASRGLSYLRIYSRIFRVKLVFFGASDVNFQPGMESIHAEHDKKLFRFGLRDTQYVVVQNTLQQELLKVNYNNTNSIIIPNIWDTTSQESYHFDTDFILWVGNFRTLKRPDWFLRLSERFSEESFVMVGAPLDKKLYEKCKSRANQISNMTFLGTVSFKKVNALFAASKVFVCTSEIEGFPNAFLQAWANSKPIITTFDPSGIVKREGLGIVVNNEQELEKALNTINNEVLYQQMQNNIASYFKESHSTQKAFEMLTEFLKVDG